jgi:rod shape-determining protein MreC
MVSQQPWAAGARGFAKGALAPLEGVLTAAGDRVSQLTSGFGDSAKLRAENERLRAQNAELQRQVAELQSEGLDNQALRQALDFERTYGRSMVAAQVVGRGPDGFSITLEIDRGSRDGVRAGMVVVSGAGLVGKVTETGPHAAIVETLADPQSRVNAFLSRSALEGTVAGGPDSLQMVINPRFGITPADGEWAITSGVGGGYPRGLVVGVVSSVTHRDSATNDSARVTWINDPSALSIVMVIEDFTPS